MWYYSNGTLKHFGVLGMKWGVRKDYQSVGRRKGYTIPEKKSGHRVRLEAKYLKKGYSDNDAEQMAAKRIRGEKFVVGALAVAAVAGASYIGYREIGKRYSGVVMEAGKDLHYINALGDKATYDRRLYTSFEKGDTKKYKGLLATALRQNSKEPTTIYDTALRATEKIKAPSQHEARKLYSEYLKKSVSVRDYNNFNKDFVYGGKQANDFFQFLKTKGYNAILDSNDQFLSGFNSHKPLVIFNANSSLKKVGETIVSKKMSDGLNRQQMAALYAKAWAPTVGLGAAVIGGTSALNTKLNYGVVKEYFAKNPNTKYSYGAVYNALKVDKNGVMTVDEKKLKGV